ncbi:hypothetical protein CEXT_508771 [Caerostris extrusa]|uniref:LAGLIDADG homing endonuclease n=1 Tax=Caerostris extrusa TaxID=172846 RepID=A0AAV4XJZ7_CAEEX|nr:hypothetical protein CEXT_508771 [Caerostris extrusa]
MQKAFSSHSNLSCFSTTQKPSDRIPVPAECYVFTVSNINSSQNGFCRICSESDFSRAFVALQNSFHPPFSNKKIHPIPFSATEYPFFIRTLAPTTKTGCVVGRSIFSLKKMAST